MEISSFLPGSLLNDLTSSAERTLSSINPCLISNLLASFWKLNKDLIAATASLYEKTIAFIPSRESVSFPLPTAMSIKVFFATRTSPPAAVTSDLSLT